MFISTDYKILLALFEKGKLGFRDLSRFHIQPVDAGISPRILRRHLDSLIQKGLVREEGRKSWKPGKKLFYSLTAKGAEQLAVLTRDDLNSVLRRIQKVITRYSADPTKIIQWYKTALKRSLVKLPPLDIWPSNLDDNEKEFRRIQSYSEEEAAEEIQRVEKIFEPLRECFRMLFKLFLIVDQVDLYSDVNGIQDDYKLEDWVIGFAKSGWAYYIPVDVLKMKEIIPSSL